MTAPGLSRRGFIGAACTGATAGALGLMFPMHGQPITTVHTNVGTHSLWYGPHTKSIDPHDFPVGGNALMIEGGASYEDHAERWEVLPKQLCEFPQYKTLLPIAAERKLPVYLTDPTVYNTAMADVPSVVEMLEGIGALAIGYGLYAAKPSRREMGAYGTIMSWLLYPALVNGINRFRNTPATREIRRSKDVIHPELSAMCFAILDVRNVIIAHKLEWLMGLLGTPCHIVSVFGTEHSGIGGELTKAPPQRIEWLTANRDAITRRFVKRTLPIITRYDYRQSQWQRTEQYTCPDLATVFSPT